MLTGTLVTAAGFLPIATAQSSTGEYTRSMFQVVTIALVVSWIVAVLFIPYLGDKLLPDMRTKPHAALRTARRPRRTIAVRRTPFYQPLPRAASTGACAHRWIGDRRHRGRVRRVDRCCSASCRSSSSRIRRRPELMVDMWLAEGASLRATEAQAQTLEQLLARPRGHRQLRRLRRHRLAALLPAARPAAAAAELRAVRACCAKDTEAREAVRDWLIDDVCAATSPTCSGRVTRLENGPPVGYPVQFRVSGEHIDQRARASPTQVEAKVRANPHVANVNLDWDEPSKVVRLAIDQDRARALGVSSAQAGAVPVAARCPACTSAPTARATS